MSIEGAWKLWTDGIQQYGNARNALSSMPQQGVNALNTPRKESPMDLYLDRVDRARREALDKASVLFAGRNVQADQIISAAAQIEAWLLRAAEPPAAPSAAAAATESA